MLRRARLFSLFLALTLGSAGCFATRGDVAKLQLSILTLQDSVRLQQARSDDAHRTQMITLARQVAREVGAVNDTLKAMGEILRTFRGDVTLWSHSVNEQLITLAEQTGISQRRLQELKANVEAGEARMAAGAAPALGAPAAGTQAAAPPPTQLFQIARAQLRAGATGAARAGFEEFLAQYPTHELAADAQMGLGDALDFEGNKAAADSAYALVVAKYPASTAASRSLYKRGMIYKEAGRNADALSLFQQLITRYPRADEKPLAEEHVRTLKRP